METLILHNSTLLGLMIYKLNLINLLIILKFSISCKKTTEDTLASMATADTKQSSPAFKSTKCIKLSNGKQKAWIIIYLMSYKNSFVTVTIAYNTFYWDTLKFIFIIMLDII